VRVGWLVEGDEGCCCEVEGVDGRVELRGVLFQSEDPAEPAQPVMYPHHSPSRSSLVERDCCVRQYFALQVDKPLQLRHLVDSCCDDGLEDAVGGLNSLGGCGVVEWGGREGELKEYYWPLLLFGQGPQARAQPANPAQATRQIQKPQPPATHMAP